MDHSYDLARGDLVGLTGPIMQSFELSGRHHR